MRRIVAASIFCLLYGTSSGYCGPAPAQQAGSQPQPSCSTACPSQVWLPISGHVTDGVTGALIANAVVTYSGIGDSVNQTGEAANPPSMNGEVRTHEDGTFALPQLVPGSFEVRVSAHGYLSAQRYLSEIPAGYRPVPDGNFPLQPTSIEVKQMSSTTQNGFGLPPDNPFQMPNFSAAAFSADGQRLALVGAIPSAKPDSAAWQFACVGWIYDLGSDHLQRIKPELPRGFCNGLPQRIHWENDIVVLKMTYSFDPDDNLETVHWRDGSAEITSVEKLSRIPSVAQDGFRVHDGENVVDKTDDGKFFIVDVSQDCRQCRPRTMVISRQRNWKIQIQNPTDGYSLDHEKDRLVSLFQNIGVQTVDLKSRRQQIITVPGEGLSSLVAAQLLSDGRTSLAYTVFGACDPFSPTAPHVRVAGYRAASFTKRSLCIVTAPAQEEQR